MVKAGAIRLLYFGYNFLSKNRLEKYYKEVSEHNKPESAFNIISLKNYLKRWGFNSTLELNPLMSKKNIIESSGKADLSKIKSWAYTGGSYGEPIRIPYSLQRNLIRTATFKYFNEQGGYHLGDPFVLIRAKNKSSIQKYFRNETIFLPLDVSESRLNEFVQELKRKKIKVLMGYPTVIYELAQYLFHHPEKKKGLSLKSIITVSEPLEDYKRQLIPDIFQCKVIDRYSNEEVGLIAQQKEFGGEYFVNKYGVYTEVINPDTLKPVQEGEQGKVVVTDVYNDLIPVIRYDTGDLATVHRYSNGQLVSIANIIGRVNEQIFSISNQPVSPLALGPFIYKPLSHQGEVFQYQFAQLNASQYELRIRAKVNQLPEDLIHEIISGLEDALGKGSTVSLKLVEEIKPLPSGKRPIFKNEMSNKNHISD